MTDIAIAFAISKASIEFGRLSPVLHQRREHKQLFNERFAYLDLAVADDERTLVNAPPTVPIFRAGVAGHEEQVAAVDINSLSTAEVLPCDAGHAFTLSTVPKKKPEAPSNMHGHNNEQSQESPLCV